MRKPGRRTHVYRCHECGCDCTIELRTTKKAEENREINTLPDACIFSDAEIKPKWEFIHTRIECNINGSYTEK